MREQSKAKCAQEMFAGAWVYVCVLVVVRLCGRVWVGMGVRERVKVRAQRR